MDTKNVILELRTKMGLSQDELAEKVFVTRQAVSRWENGETTPNIETLKLLSKLFDVSINTLLGSPRQLICQCCGMPLADGDISRETDGFFNEEYCKWCYADGEYMYHNLDDLIEVCVQNMASVEFPAEQARAYLKDTLPKLNYWKRYENLGGAEAFEKYKQALMDEFNNLHIAGMPFPTEKPSNSLTIRQPISATSWNVNLGEIDASALPRTWIFCWSVPMRKTAKTRRWSFTRRDKALTSKPKSSDRCTAAVRGFLLSEQPCVQDRKTLFFKISVLPHERRHF